MEYRIQQKATIWYETKIEANSPEEAIELAQNPGPDLEVDWWQALDSVAFLDEFWWQDENEDEGEIGNSPFTSH